VNYTGLEPVVNTGTATTVTITLPPAVSTAVLEDDGVAGNGLSQLRSTNGSFETTTFANPSGTLTINRGNAADALTINSLPDFSAGLLIGSSIAPLASAVIAGAVTLNAGKNLSVFAIAQSVTAIGAIATSVGGAIGLTADTFDLSAGGSLNAATGIVTIATESSSRPVSLGVDTVGSLSLTDAELDRLVAGTLRIGDATFGGPITIAAAIDVADNLTPINALHLLSGGGLIDANPSGIDLTAPTLAIEGFGGNGTSNLLTIQAAILAASYVGSGDIRISNAGGLTVGTVDGLSGVGSTGGSVGITATGPLTLDGTVIGSNNVSLTAAGNDQVLTINRSVLGGTGFFTADKMKILSTINFGSGKLTLTPESSADSGDAIQLGATSNAGANILALTDDEFFISAGEVQIGDANSGPISITADFQPFPADALRLVSGGAINVVSGVVNTSGKNLTLSPGAAASVNFAKSGTDVNLGTTGTLAFTSGSDLAIAINGATVDMQYQQLNVVGIVD